MAASPTYAAKPYHYWQCCVDFSEDVELLIAMIDTAVDITYRTFFQHCDLEEARTLLCYDKHWKQGLTLKKDWHVSYHRSTYNGKRCYFLCHSGIEYIFVREETDG
jgi:hypothetical protein